MSEHAVRDKSFALALRVVKLFQLDPYGQRRSAEAADGDYQNHPLPDMNSPCYPLSTVTFPR